MPNDATPFVEALVTELCQRWSKEPDDPIIGPLLGRLSAEFDIDNRAIFPADGGVGTPAPCSSLPPGDPDGFSRSGHAEQPAPPDAIGTDRAGPYPLGAIAELHVGMLTPILSQFGIDPHRVFRMEITPRELIIQYRMREAPNLERQIWASVRWVPEP